MGYRIRFQAREHRIYTEWFSSLEEAMDVANAMLRVGIDVDDIEDENYEEVI